MYPKLINLKEVSKVQSIQSIKGEGKFYLSNNLKNNSNHFNEILLCTCKFSFNFDTLYF